MHAREHRLRTVGRLQRMGGNVRNWDELTQDELDEMVHEAKAAEAAEINNQGREAQIAYLQGSDGEAPAHEGP